jgi:hypothetical protein
MHVPASAYYHKPATIAFFKDNRDVVKDCLPPPEAVMRLPRREPGSSIEKDRAARRLGIFNAIDSNTWRVLRDEFGEDVALPELAGIALAVSEKIEIKPDRDVRRTKAALIKWFDENWEIIESLLLG